MHGRGTIDDQIFQLLNDKSLVTSDITDGQKASLNLNRQVIDDIKLEELAKDGTVERKNPQKSLSDFFNKEPAHNLRPRKGTASAVMSAPEIIDESDSDQEEQKRNVSSRVIDEGVQRSRSEDYSIGSSMLGEMEKVMSDSS